VNVYVSSLVVMANEGTTVEDRDTEVETGMAER
jgi:hypothetical protein